MNNLRVCLTFALLFVAPVPCLAISDSTLGAPSAAIAYPCPGPGDSCPLSFTCCLNRYIKTGQPEKTSYSYKCCEHTNGVCCGDFSSCCPDGSICHVELDTCIFPNETYVMRSRF